MSLAFDDEWLPLIFVVWQNVTMRLSSPQHSSTWKTNRLFVHALHVYFSCYELHYVICTCLRDGNNWDVRMAAGHVTVVAGLQDLLSCQHQHWTSVGRGRHRGPPPPQLSADHRNSTAVTTVITIVRELGPLYHSALSETRLRQGPQIFTVDHRVRRTHWVCACVCTCKWVNGYGYEWVYRCVQGGYEGVGVWMNVYTCICVCV